MNSQTNLEKLQTLLREIFQFDSAELDFGIYRIMNYKREVIEKFITKDLVEAISAELSRGALAEQTQAAKELKGIMQKIRETLGEDAIDENENLAEAYHKAPLGKKYLELKAKATGVSDQSALEAAVYNHLYAFFSRYYDNGDFMSKRRYSKKEKYAIPYNGEEVYLHWANSDQYYIKTGEYFTNYSFKSHGITVHFKLQNADIEQDNVKGDKRFFIPLAKAATFDAKAKQVVIPFEYRPLTKQEEISYGKKNQQDAIIAEAIKAIPKQFKNEDKILAALLAERRKNSDGKSVSFLEHHLRQYTRRNTSDFFIHKNLRAFLERELDFYLKNEVLNLDELEAGGEAGAEGWFQIMRVIKNIGRSIILFLAQIEDFQKKLFEKKKFVTATQYCITIGSIAEDFYGDIADCEAQWQEWKELLHIDEKQQNLFNVNAKSKKERRVAFLKAHPTLVLDTQHFGTNFVDRLIASFDDLDGMTDGLLIHGENFQALNLLLEKYREKVKCIYIDPPYNSKTTEILYKNNYKHSSWLTLMDNRLAVSRRLAAPDGSHVVAIDENEQEVLGRLLAMHFPDHERVCVAVVHNKKGIQGDYFSYNHDYAYFCIPPLLPETHGKPIPESEWEYDNLRKWGRESERETAKNCFYPIFVEGDRVVGFGDVCDGGFHPKRANVPCDKAGRRIAVYPVDSQSVERKWRYSRDSVEGIRQLLKVHVTSSGEIQIQKAKAEKRFKTVWDDSIYIAGDYGTKWLTDLGLKLKEDLYPKSIYTVMDSIYTVSGKCAIVLDYFAGSGTTGHAVIKLNQDDGGRRRFILAEMGEYFGTVLLPRIKKVTFTPEWKEGKPVRHATEEEAKRSPRIVKYQQIESYEDALNNISFTLPKGQTVLKFDDYLLNYMLQFEARGSETILNVEKLVSPFSYKLILHEGQETQEKVVDLPETFNYLLGLNVKTRRVYHDKDRRYLVYRGTVDHKEAVIIWRETKGWEKKDFERDKKFVADQKITDGADEVFVNGDSFVPRAKALEPVFKHRMFGGV